MKKIFVFIAALSLALASCSNDEGTPSKDGAEQVPQPVENSGPNTEGQRAVEATVNDSTESDNKGDSTPIQH